MHLQHLDQTFCLRLPERWPRTFVQIVHQQHSPRLCERAHVADVLQRPPVAVVAIHEQHVARTALRWAASQARGGSGTCVVALAAAATAAR